MKALRLFLLAGVGLAQTWKSSKEERKWKRKQAKLKNARQEATQNSEKNRFSFEPIRNETGAFINTPGGRVEVFEEQSLDDFVAESEVSCWTCNGLDEDECGARGSWQACHGDQICAVEIRRRGSRFEGIQMGCKQAQACYTARNENFHDPQESQQQCKLGSKFLSVCRQCCINKKCFVSHGLNLRGDVPIPWKDFTKQMWVADYNIG